MRLWPLNWVNPVEIRNCRATVSSIRCKSEPLIMANLTRHKEISMFRLLLLISILTSSTSFGKDGIYVPSYSLCEAAHYDNIGSTTEYLYREFDRVVEANSDLPYLEFRSKRDEENYRVGRPIIVSEVSRHQVGQQHYWICVQITEQ